MTGSPLVVKFGGSLLRSIPDLIPVLRSSRNPLLIVPGGALFADAVRSARVTDDHAAHWMAIAAMEQYGMLLETNGLGSTYQLAVPETTRVLLPYCILRKIDPLPHLWDVTSDTIAAWVADYLGLDLLVLKSVDGIMSDGVLIETVNSRMESDTVDPSFLSYVLDRKIRTTIINGSSRDRVAGYLDGEAVPGTRIGTTF